MAFQRIASLSADADGECVWSAPSHPDDMKPADWQRLLLALERKKAELERKRAESDETGNA